MRTNAHSDVCAECGRDVAPGEGVHFGFGDDGVTMCAEHSPSAPPRSLHDGWHTRALASLHFSCTGVDPLTDHILSYALLSDAGPDRVGLVNPGVRVSSAAVEMHGITREAVLAAPVSKDAVGMVLEWIGDLIWREVGLVVFNASFDLTLLRAEATRHNLKEPAWEDLAIIDPFVIDWGIERGRLGSRRLADIAEYYGVSMPEFGTPADDAKAAREVAIELGARHPNKVAPTFEMVMAQQRFWAAARSMDWNRFALRKGRRMDVSSNWPFARDFVS